MEIHILKVGGKVVYQAWKEKVEGRWIKEMAGTIRDEEEWNFSVAAMAKAEPRVELAGKGGKEFESRMLVEFGGDDDGEEIITIDDGR